MNNLNKIGIIAIAISLIALVSAEELSNNFDKIYVNSIHKNTSDIEINNVSKIVFSNETISYINKSNINKRNITIAMGNTFSNNISYISGINFYSSETVQSPYLIPSFIIRLKQPQTPKIVLYGYSHATFFISYDGDIRYEYYNYGGEESIQIKYLAGTGNAFVCVDAYGFLYRSTVTCV